MILHIDMDAFYASVEERENPELVGKPLIIGGTADRRGVVAAANYVVRQFGVCSAMPTVTAMKLCPHAVILPPRLSLYSEISAEIREIFFHYTPLVEPLSLDEAFLDVSGSEQLFGTAIEIARKIKQEIQQTVRLIASVGVAPNKFLAKIASDLEKPDGLVVVDPDHVQDFLDPLSIRRVWGVGHVTYGKLQALEIETIFQLRQLTAERLTAQFGTLGSHLWQLAHGIDNREVTPGGEAKSISHETTFEKDVCEMEALRSCLLHLTEQVAKRLRKHGLRGKTVQIKVRYGDFQTITRAQKLQEPTNSTELLWKCASELLSNRLPQRKLSIRLLGIGVSGFNHSQLSQKMLFEDDREQHSQLDKVADSIQDRFGENSLQRGSSLKGKRPNQ